MQLWIFLDWFCQFHHRRSTYHIIFLPCLRIAEAGKEKTERKVRVCIELKLHSLAPGWITRYYEQLYECIQNSFRFFSHVSILFVWVFLHFHVQQFNIHSIIFPVWVGHSIMLSALCLLKTTRASVFR